MVLAASASAQVNVTGRVIDLQQKPVSDVIVKLVSGSKTLAFPAVTRRVCIALKSRMRPAAR